MTGNGVEPIGRFEWERLIRRIVMPQPTKYIALMLGTFADPDGTRVRPGNDLLAAAAGVSTRTIIRRLDELAAHQLIQLVSRGGGRSNAGKATEYRLTIPLDLLDRFNLLPPNGRPTPNSSDTQMSPQSHESPVDNPPNTVDNPAETVDNSNPAELIEVTKQGGSDPIEVTQLCRTTSHIDHPTTRTHLGRGTHLPDARAKRRRRPKRRRTRLRRTPAPTRGPPLASRAIPSTPPSTQEPPP